VKISARTSFYSIPWISMVLMAFGADATLGDVAALRRRR